MKIACLALTVVLIIGCVIFGVKLYRDINPRRSSETVDLKNFIDDSLMTLKPIESSTADETEAPPEPYKSPVDFKALQEINPDIYAWLSIPQTDISFPVFCRADDDEYYLRRDMFGNYDINGVLFSEATYNKTDLEDPLTIIYGHNMEDGSMLGTLQSSYLSSHDMENRHEVIVYMPERELHYEVFAAVPFDNRHILYNYDFTDSKIFELFFNEILSVRAFESVFREGVSVSAEDKTLILSTCLTGNSTKRYLLCAKLSTLVQ